MNLVFEITIRIVLQVEKKLLTFVIQFYIRTLINWLRIYKTEL